MIWHNLNNQISVLLWLCFENKHFISIQLQSVLLVTLNDNPHCRTKQRRAVWGVYVLNFAQVRRWRIIEFGTVCLCVAQCTSLTNQDVKAAVFCPFPTYTYRVNHRHHFLIVMLRLFIINFLIIINVKSLIINVTHLSKP